MCNVKQGISSLLVITALHPQPVLAIPQATLNIEHSNRYGLLINPRYANLLNPTSAFGFEIGFGDSEFRLAGTWATVARCKHVLKFTADYLSQQNSFTFLTGSTLIWGTQATLAGGYSYLLQHPIVKSWNLLGYQLHSRTDRLPTVEHVSDNVQILYRNLRGTDGYGAMTGLTFLPLSVTRIDIDAYYDTLHYNNKFTSALHKNGCGAGIRLFQVLHPQLALELYAASRSIYASYIAKISWLIPTRTCPALELSASGQWIQGNALPEPEEARVGIMLTYRWQPPGSNASHLTPYNLQEGVLASATRPLVRMAQTFVTVDEGIVN